MNWSDVLPISALVMAVLSLVLTVYKQRMEGCFPTEDDQGDRFDNKSSKGSGGFVAIKHLPDHKGD